MRFGLRQAATQVDVAASSSTAPSITVPGALLLSLLVPVASIWDANTTWTVSSVTVGGIAVTAFANYGTRAADRAAASLGLGFSGVAGDTACVFNLAGTSGGSNRYYTLGCYEFTFLPYSLSIGVDSFPSVGEVDTSAADISVSGVTAQGADTVIVHTAALDSDDAALNFGSPAGTVNHYRQNAAASFVGMDSSVYFADATFTAGVATWTHDNNANDRGAAIVVSIRTLVPMRSGYKELRNELAAHRTGWPSAVNNIKSWF